MNKIIDKILLTMLQLKDTNTQLMSDTKIYMHCYSFSIDRNL